MIHAIWIFTVSMAAIFLEIALGRFGILVPLFLAVAFYFLTIYPVWRIVALLGVLAMMLDLSFGRQGYLSLAMIFMALYGMKIWRRYGDCRRPVMQFIPGAILGLIWGGGLFITERLLHYPPHWRTVFSAILLCLQALVMGGLALPVVTTLLDAVAERLDLPEYGLIHNQYERRRRLS